MAKQSSHKSVIQWMRLKLGGFMAFKKLSHYAEL
jgi:hypothetical protein